MLKKLFVTAAAAAAVSVPLAGAAWAAPPSDPGSPNGNGIGAGGVPERGGNFLDSFTPNPSPNPGGPVPPGSVFKVAAKTPCTASGTAVKCSTPDAYGEALQAFRDAYGSQVDPPVPQGTPIVSTPPGKATKAFTPGCGHGNALNVDGTIGGADDITNTCIDG